MKEQKGQGLVEYLILVCLIAVSAIAVVTVVSTNIKEQFANVSNALRGRPNQKLTEPSPSDYQSRDFSNYNQAKGGHGLW